MFDENYLNFLRDFFELPKGEKLVSPRRERIAAQVLTGLAACPRCHENRAYDAASFADTAIEFADALIARLDRGEP